MIDSKTNETSQLDILFGVMKFIVFVSMIILFLIHHGLIRIFFWNEEKRLSYYLTSISLTSKIVLGLLNVKVEFVGVRGEVNKKLIVANHLSYLDVLILASEVPALFVTSLEIKETFGLGHICQLAGCFFVERRKELRTPDTKHFEISSMREKLVQGHNILLFPEGTSSDGQSVLPFKATFFQLAIDTETAVQPICLKYTGANAQVIPWYGEMTFLDHLLKVCIQDSIHAKLIFLSNIETNCADKFEISHRAHLLIKDAYEKA